MKKLVSILVLTLVLFSCSKDDAPEPVYVPTTKVIEKIETKTTLSGSGTVVNEKITFEYNSNKEISKISAFSNGALFYSYTYVYQNTIPVSSIYDFPNGGDPAYQVTYGYTNGKYSSYFDSQSNSTTIFTYNEQFNQYTNTDSNSRFILNENDDILIKTITLLNNEFSYNFDSTKKGPLFNVKNKKWIPVLWFGCNNEKVNTITTHPVTAIFDDNNAQANPYTNTYDAEGFISKSEFTINNGNEIFEIMYTYKSI